MAKLTEEQVFWYEEGHLGAENEEKLLQLREQLLYEGAVVEGLEDRNALLRFLKARQWCVHKAAKMYKVSKLLEDSALGALRWLSVASNHLRASFALQVPPFAVLVA